MRLAEAGAFASVAHPEPAVRLDEPHLRERRALEVDAVEEGEPRVLVVDEDHDCVMRFGDRLAVHVERCLQVLL
jgi:hypothetical protein